MDEKIEVTFNYLIHLFGRDEDSMMGYLTIFFEKLEKEFGIDITKQMRLALEDRMKKKSWSEV